MKNIPGTLFVKIEHLPTELIENIATSLGPKDIRAPPNTCCQLRSKLERTAQSEVLLRGCQCDLLGKIEFLDPQASSERLSRIRFVSRFTRVLLFFSQHGHGKTRAIVERCDHYPVEAVARILQEEHTVANAVVSALTAMTPIQSLTINVVGMSGNYQKELAHALRHMPRLSLQNLEVKASERVAILSLIKRIDANLKAWHLSESAGARVFTEAAKSFQKHESIHVCAVKDGEFCISAPSNGELKSQIEKLFPQVKTLILSDSPSSI